MSSRNTSAEFEGFLHPDVNGIITIPSLVKGRLVYPKSPSINELRLLAHRFQSNNSTNPASCQFSTDDVHVIRHPIVGRTSNLDTGEYYFQIFHQPDPKSLIESDFSVLSKELYSLPFDEILSYIRALKFTLISHTQILLDLAKQTSHQQGLDKNFLELLFSQIPALFDADAIAAAVDEELGSYRVPGRQYLDRWVQEGGKDLRQGMMARFARHIFDEKDPNLSIARPPGLRAIPTRQLHITAGNSPIIPLMSLLRGLATKGAVVIKSASEVCLVNGLLAHAMHALDPNHPITKHTSLVYWKGGDRNVEDILFADGAFDRLVVWGTSESVANIKARAPRTKVIFLNPRYGLSLIDLRTYEGNFKEPAQLASIDSMIGNQRACTASLIHYVVGSRAQSLQYCEALKAAFACWDRNLPQITPNYIQGYIRMLKRGVLFKGVWFENSNAGQITSSVIHMSEPFAIDKHPMSRFIIVRPILKPEALLPYLNSAVSTVGVYPENLVDELRDPMTAAGVTSVCRLGECEQGYPGMPHDGMRVLSELVNWSVA